VAWVGAEHCGRVDGMLRARRATVELSPLGVVGIDTVVVARGGPETSLVTVTVAGLQTC